jgi:uncharacterized protein (TIGR00296 family)
MLNLPSGAKLVKLARKSVENFFENKKLKTEKVSDAKLKEKRGVFVTIETYPEKNLRGCVGIISKHYELHEGVQRAAVSAAFEDTRFPPLKKEELEKIIFEVSILTEPELIKVKKPDEHFEKIKIGEDGLIIQNGPRSGLLLPQVATDFGWDAKEFLDNLCFKAFLTPDYIFDKNTKLWKFQTQIFSEEKPRGKIISRT